MNLCSGCNYDKGFCICVPACPACGLDYESGSTSCGLDKPFEDYTRADWIDLMIQDFKNHPPEGVQK